jgi:glycosyltransferase involved in cell wall biosynthesis
LAHFLNTSAHPLAGRTILQIIPELEAGGAERTTVDIAEGLVEAGARALVATEGGRLVGELQAKGGTWIAFPAATKNPLSMALNVQSLVNILKRDRVDIVHARSRAPAWVAYAACRITKLPFVTTYHGSYSARSAAKNLYNSVMARGDVVIANSDYTANLIRTAHPQARDRLRVVPRGTDFQRFTAHAVAPERVQALRTQWSIGPHQRIVLLAGRLTAWKGQRVLIDAARLLVDRGVGDVSFIMAGDAQGRDDYARSLHGAIAAAGLEKQVHIVGHVVDMPAALLAAAVVTVPSTQPEAFGRVAVEAQAIGAPVVVSDLGAVRETVLAPPDVAPEQRTGWRVPASDPVALADAIEAVLALRPSARDALSQRARAHVELQFSLDRMVARTLDIYSAIIEQRRS